MGWQRIRLADAVTLHTGKLDSNAAVPGGEYPFFTCAQETSRIDKFAFDTEAVLLGGNNAVGVFPLKYFHGQFNAYQRTYVIETKNGDVLSTRYLYYALRPALMHFKSASIGAATQYLTKGILDTFPILVPPIDVQRRIVASLASYDDLITNNARRIELLERSVRLLYEEWFVRVRYPGHGHDKIVDGLPVGWERKPLEGLADITFGQSPKSEFYNEDGIGVPFHQGVADFGTRFVIDRVYCTAAGKTGNGGDILFSVRAPVGRINLTRNKIILGRGLAAIASKNGNQNFLFYALKQTFFKDDLMGSGAIFAAITSKDLRTVLVTMPTPLLVDEFQRIAEPIDRQIRVLSDSIVKATQARDLLLPRVMDGRIEV